MGYDLFFRNPVRLGVIALLDEQRMWLAEVVQARHVPQSKGQVRCRFAIRTIEGSVFSRMLVVQHGDAEGLFNGRDRPFDLDFHSVAGSADDLKTIGFQILHHLVVIGEAHPVGDDGDDHRGDEKADDEFGKPPPDFGGIGLAPGLGPFPTGRGDDGQDEGPAADPHVAADHLHQGEGGHGLIGHGGKRALRLGRDRAATLAGAGRTDRPRAPRSVRGNHKG